MSYLLDTKVVSQLRRKLPNPSVVSWFSHRPASTLFLSVLTLGELRKGIDGAADPARRMALSDWLETELPSFFAGRILNVDAQTADRWGRLVAAAGRPPTSHRHGCHCGTARPEPGHPQCPRF